MRILIGIIILGVVLFASLQLSEAQQSVSSEKTELTPTVTPSISPVATTELERTIFIPYWNIPTDADKLTLYDRLVYFGITATTDGIDKTDDAYKGLSDFMDLEGDKSKAITLRMLDTESNTIILEDEALQEQLIDETINILRQGDVDELVLDLEMSVLPVTDVKQNISEFTARLAKKLHASDMRLSMTVYGDTIYRGRPYDLKALANSVDEFYLMTYDFHKVHGEPGPNFPFADDNVYPYNFKDMLSDMRTYVDAENLTVILGMYGYDWTLGQQGLPLKAAKALSLKDIKAMLGETCELQQCKLNKTQEGKEPSVSYKDSDGYMHTVWFEDEESAQEKIKYMQQQGIGSVAYWVWGYF
ncbi:MAG: glycosyl hydrolase family 18 protein [Weeksellaceae bacterium]